MRGMAMFLAVALAAAFLITGAQAGEDRVEADKLALAKVQDLIGQWKGGGKPAQGDAWSETFEWAWAFEDGRALLAMKTADGKYFKDAKLVAGEAADAFTLTATAADGSAQTYAGAINRFKDLELVNAQAGEGQPARITLSLLARGKRLTVLYERKLPGGADRFGKLAEVGATKQGSGFGKNANANVCVVTGGEGTIAVEYKGKTYYVCCTGCKQAFLDNPEKEIAGHEKRKAAEAAKK